MINNLWHLTQLLDNAFENKPNNQALIGLEYVINYDQLYRSSLKVANNGLHP